MTGQLFRYSTTTVVMLALAGCASAEPRTGFADVEQLVSERTGQRIYWNQGTDADREVDASVRALLGRELAADAAVQVALLNSADLQAVYEDLAVAQADLAAAGLLKNPVFDADLRFAEGGAGTGVDLSLTQEFLAVFQIPLRQKIASAQLKTAMLRVAGAVLDRAAEVRSAYYDCQAAQQLVEMRQTAARANEASYDLSKRLRQAGNVTELAMSMERAKYEQPKLDHAAAEARAVELRERLNALMGLWGPAASAWSAAPRLPDVPDEEPLAENAERRAVADSLDLGALRHQIESAGRTLGQTRTFGLVPDVELGAAAEREIEGTWSVGPAVSLPLPFFNQGQPHVAAAAAELRRARAQYAATAVQVGAFDQLRAREYQVEAGARLVEATRAHWQARAALDAILSGRLRGGGGELMPVVGGENPDRDAGASGGH